MYRRQRREWVVFLRIKDPSAVVDFADGQSVWVQEYRDNSGQFLRTAIHCTCRKWVECKHKTDIDERGFHQPIPITRLDANGKHFTKFGPAVLRLGEKIGS